MATYDKSTTPACLDSYASSIAKLKQQASNYEAYVRTNLVGADAQAEKKERQSWTDLKFAQNVFDSYLSDKQTLQQQLAKLQEEMSVRIAKATEEAKKEGKSDEEISLITSNISAEYSDRIRNLNFNIARAGRTTLLKQNTLADAKSIYTTDHFTRISTSNDVYSGFMQASRNWHEVGNMQRYYGFLQSISDNSQRKFDYDG